MYKIKKYKVYKENYFLEDLNNFSTAIVCAFPGVGKTTLLDNWNSSKTCYGELIDLDFGNSRSILEDELGIRFSAFSSTIQNLVQQFYISTAESLSSGAATSANRNSQKPNMVLCNIPDVRFEAMVVPHPRCEFTYVQGVKKRDPNNKFAVQYEKNFKNWVNGWIDVSFQAKAQHQILYLLTEGIYLSDMHKGKATIIELILNNEPKHITKTVRLVVRDGRKSTSMPFVETLLNYINLTESEE